VRTALGVGLALAMVMVLMTSSIAPTAPDEGCGQKLPALDGVLDSNDPLVRASCAGQSFLGSLQRLLAARGIDKARLWTVPDIEIATGEDAIARWHNNRQIALLGPRLWSVPAAPDWTEDPYHDVTWQRGYQSLIWLDTLAEGYRRGDTNLGNDLRKYLLSWIEHNPPDAPASERAWYDGAVWRRTTAIVAMWDVLTKVLTQDDLATVIASLEVHGEVLQGYLSEARFRGHNHNMFHALALFNLAEQIPQFANSASWRAASIARIGPLMREMVNPEDGVSTEQSANYHYTALWLFRDALNLLQQWQVDLGTTERELIRRATTYGALLMDPGGLLPAIGDTPLGTSASRAFAVLDQLRRDGLTSSAADFVLTRGAAGRRPADAVFFRGEGYAIFRASYSESGPWQDDAHLFVDFGRTTRGHGHDDTGNLLLSAFGRQLLIDSGGPYQYHVADRRYFLSPQAHNVVVADGGSYRSGDATIDWAVDEAAYSLVQGHHDRMRGVRHRRTVILLKPSTLVVVDEVKPRDQTAHDYQILWHFPPEAVVQTTDHGATMQVPGAGLHLATAASAPISARVRSGESQPLFGWVTTSHGKRVPAPVLTDSWSARASWVVTVLQPFGQTMGTPPSVEAKSTRSAIAVSASVDGQTWRIKIPVEGRPSVQADASIATDSGEVESSRRLSASPTATNTKKVMNPFDHTGFTTASMVMSTTTRMPPVASAAPAVGARARATGHRDRRVSRMKAANEMTPKSPNSAAKPP
jgi:Heparinase II/III-like protein/Heparinase II/III N-terminus